MKSNRTIKFLSCAFLLVLLTAFVQAQNVRVLRSFDSLPLNENKFGVISMIEQGLPEFKFKKKYGAETFVDGKREAVKYQGENYEMITLIFYNGFLYKKQLDILYFDVRYSDIAKKEFENLNKHIKSTHKILKQMESISRWLGEQDGQGYSYYTEKSGDKFVKDVGIMFKRLFDNDGTFGYSIEYSVVDVSKTEYDIDKLSTPGLQ